MNTYDIKKLGRTWFESHSVSGDWKETMTVTII